ncbi:MAG: leucine-rich repeat domain-containing protein [Clostridia bacterium]|nr:leucine-rich repeat domain-containing protein [Clostridia bacterium]
MKKLIIAMMIIALVVVMAVSVSAAPAPATDFDYEVVGEAVTIKKYKGTTTEVEIPATIEGKPVTVIGEGAFNDIRTITKIVIPEGIVTIEKQAFYNCRGITEIVVPNSVKTIGDEAFYNCRTLESFTLGSGVTSIGVKPIESRALTTLKLTGGDNAYFKVENGCLVDIANKKLLVGAMQETVIIPAGVEIIGEYALYGHGATDTDGDGTSETWVKHVVKTIVVADGVKVIEKGAFDATSVQVLVLPKSVTEIGNALAANTPLHKNKKFNLELGNIYYEGTEEEYKAITKGGSNNAISGANAPIHYNSCINNPNGWTHSEGATCTYCNPPAGGQTPPAGGTTPNAPQTGSTVTVLAVVAVVALAATAVVISKRRIED